LTDNVSNLETTLVQTKETLGSLKHNLLETNENYVKDKDQLTQTKTNITDRHETASVRNKQTTSLKWI
jgi:hypothetical protein